MDPKIQKIIDDIMIETNEKVSAIVNEIRDIRFSRMDEQGKETKCDKLREEFKKIMVEEERKIEKVMTDSNEN
jgi:TRAP-type C4-dicarboxylate transport system substrate-binding protein